MNFLREIEAVAMFFIASAYFGRPLCLALLVPISSSKITEFSLNDTCSLVSLRVLTPGVPLHLCV